MDHFDLDDYTVDNYQKLFDREFIGKQLDDGIIFFRDGYDFLAGELCTSWRGDVLREDRSMLFKAALCEGRTYGRPRKDRKPERVTRHLYVAREISHNWAIASDLYRKLSRLHRGAFRRARFEKLIGVAIDRNADTDWLFHTYSGGLEFFHLSPNMPTDLREEIETVLAQGVKELHQRGIEYFDPLPTNMRYDFRGKLVCNPHNSVAFKDSPYAPGNGLEKSVDAERDIGIILYTHDWIVDPESFVAKYFGKKGTPREISDALAGARMVMTGLEYGDFDAISQHWQKRGKVAASRLSY